MHSVISRRLFCLCLASAISLGAGMPGSVFAEKGGHGGDHGGGNATVEHGNRGGDHHGADVKVVARDNDRDEHRGDNHGAAVRAVARENNSHANMHVSVRHDNGHGNDFRQAQSNFKKDMSDARDRFKHDRNEARGKHDKQAAEDARKDFKEARENAREDRKEAFNDIKDRRNDDLNNHDRDDNRNEDRDEHRSSNDRDFRRIILVQGQPIDMRTLSDRHLVLFNVPDDHDMLIRVFRDNRHDNNNDFLSRLRTIFVPRDFEPGRTISDSALNSITLLPLSVNSQLGIPANPFYRVGIIGNQLVLIDTDRRLVLDQVAFDNNDQLIARDLNLPDANLYLVRLTNDDNARIRTYLTSHPNLVGDTSFGARFRNDFLLPLGIGGRLAIGERLPSTADVVYLPNTLVTDLIPSVGLPSTDLRLGLVGDDLVLLDPRTSMVLDLKENII